MFQQFSSAVILALGLILLGLAINNLIIYYVIGGAVFTIVGSIGFYKQIKKSSTPKSD